MHQLVYRKIEQGEIHKIIELCNNYLDFPIGNEDKMQKNWTNIDATGAFFGDNLIALLITDPYNLVRWTSENSEGRNIKSQKERIYVKTAFLLHPVIASEYSEMSDEISVNLMDAYFDSMTFCDELILYTTADTENAKRRKMLQNMGFQPDCKFPKKMILKTTWDYFLEKKIYRVLFYIKNFLKKIGLPCGEIHNNLIYTELLDVIIYILVEQHQDEHIIIKFFGYLSALPEINQEVVRYLLELNHYSTYGSFCVDPDGNIIVIASKLGPLIEEKDMEISIKSIAMVIARYSDDMVARFGGESLFDCILSGKPSFPGNYRYLLGEG